ncbi:alpha/beta fold hydrolase [Nitrosophilus kaiyonis]|uniref:alpha/beta fold hydrolase n=1 Tax=Nitrosophilus kaiyonis TaxID=2930200 RepID=UPI002492FEDF|nr:alpha/beta hydrolase [Nitrosophilus kaiyonis]
MAIKEISYKDKRFVLSYDISNLKEKKNIIFLHGWGSNKEIMKNSFDKYVNDFKAVYIDLPGFGKSINKEILTTKDYANIIEIFLKELNIKKDIIVGHSFGGKVATLLNPNLLVLLSSAGILEKKPFSVRFKITIFKMLKPFGGKKIRDFFVSNDAKKMSENMYETFKNVVNEDFSEHFRNYDKKALVFWGKDDKATSLDSGKKIASLIKQSKFYEFEGDHYFFINNAKKIMDIIRKEYENI